MYEEFFQFKQLPFENTPDPRFFYDSEQHREALAAIEYTIRLRKGIVLVTGDIGSGKTTVGRKMLARCGDQATIAQVVHAHTDRADLIAHVLRAIGVTPPAGAEHARLLEILHEVLIEHAQRRRPVVLFVDEAQNLTDEALEELRLISNFDTNTVKLLQLVLVGQPELRQRIAQPRMLALRQRIVLAKQLKPMSRVDTAAYIEHRLQAASIDPERVIPEFDAGAKDAIFQFSRGTPRLINVVSDNTLLMSFVRESTRVTADTVEAVIDDMLPSFGEPVVRPVSPRSEWTAPRVGTRSWDTSLTL
ncbi:ExeA family protein [Mucisphaera sp.]|uniref:ExeA family protein n=1 Tax=Mucisphaera sp. TaxID=2913024 RepID=UPI003D0E4731